ncbi:hypothetical protein [Catellatospora sp. TT07R-123]|uniref:hypothetical protein n=1 Tax=Catellatospora sp. TT07R-123 TaxID=2733863 RepID=UPI001BB3AE54|nr:hypothetical protein [Catellatospora sp. TT07R-123]
MLELILAALATAVVDLVLTVAVLGFVAVVQWFLDVQAELDDDDVAFTVTRALDTGGYTVYQGIFNQGSDRLGPVRRVDAQRLDPALARAHAREPLVVFA